MADPPIDIEKVVREVLANLGQVEGAPAQSPSSPGSRQAPAAAPLAAANGELVVHYQVVTMAEVAERLDGIRRMVVPPQAVVTPSVRDELQRRKITLVHDQPAASSAGDVGLMIVVVGSGFDPAPLIGAFNGEQIAVRTQRSDCLIGATDELSGELARPGAIGLLVSTCPAVALCLANRHQGVRAVLGIDAGRLAADSASIGANLLVLDPRNTSLFQLKQMAIQFCRRAAVECPESLRERLGSLAKARENKVISIQDTKHSGETL